MKTSDDLSGAFVGHRDEVTHLSRSFHVSGSTFFLSASADGTVRLWAKGSKRAVLAICDPQLRAGDITAIEHDSFDFSRGMLAICEDPHQERLTHIAESKDDESSDQDRAVPLTVYVALSTTHETEELVPGACVTKAGATVAGVADAVVAETASINFVEGSRQVARRPSENGVNIPGTPTTVSSVSSSKSAVLVYHLRDISNRTQPMVITKPVGCGDFLIEEEISSIRIVPPTSRKRPLPDSNRKLVLACDDGHVLVVEDTVSDAHASINDGQDRGEGDRSLSENPERTLRLCHDFGTVHANICSDALPLVAADRKQAGSWTMGAKQTSVHETLGIISGGYDHVFATHSLVWPKLKDQEAYGVPGECVVNETAVSGEGRPAEDGGGRQQDESIGEDLTGVPSSSANTVDAVAVVVLSANAKKKARKKRKKAEPRNAQEADGGGVLSANKIRGLTLVRRTVADVRRDQPEEAQKMAVNPPFVTHFEYLQLPAAAVAANSRRAAASLMAAESLSDIPCVKSALGSRRQGRARLAKDGAREETEHPQENEIASGAGENPVPAAYQHTLIAGLGDGSILELDCEKMRGDEDYAVLSQFEAHGAGIAALAVHGCDKVATAHKNCVKVWLREGGEEAVIRNGLAEERRLSSSGSVSHRRRRKNCVQQVVPAFSWSLLAEVEIAESINALRFLDETHLIVADTSNVIQVFEIIPRTSRSEDAHDDSTTSDPPCFFATSPCTSKE
ncbi:unnamed protein product [Amoebophrya sp. A25]|nr:unnamed protein product [Amoebophrya sp. A25]|eukprot:GSA25T00007581001.1